MAEALTECGMPEDVFQVATGRGATGAALIDQVDMIMFTGSTATGKKVMERAAQTLTPVSLELGGKDPMIVLSDADLERAANLAVFYSMQNSGQTCISVERVYVEEPVYDEFVARSPRRSRALRQGPADRTGLRRRRRDDLPAADGHRRGPRPGRAGQGRQGADRRQARAPASGDFYEPTVLVDVDHTMKAMTEETFGPTLPIMKVADAEEALRWPTTRPTGWPARSSPRTSRAASRSPAACSRARSASTTRS